MTDRPVFPTQKIDTFNDFDVLNVIDVDDRHSDYLARLEGWWLGLTPAERLRNAKDKPFHMRVIDNCPMV